MISSNQSSKKKIKTNKRLLQTNEIKQRLLSQQLLKRRVQSTE
jgi:negative regulator of sigma E activity